MAAARHLQESLRIPSWECDPATPTAIAKRSLARHRREVILPAVRASHDACPINPPLPWAWIALHTDIEFSQESFTLWWQIRALHKAYPATTCPLCDSQAQLNKEHLQQSCCPFAKLCWLRGVSPEEAFAYPTDPGWYTAVLTAIDEIVTGMHIRKQLGQLSRSAEA